jgi:hypothetical protein
MLTDEISMRLFCLGDDQLGAVNKRADAPLYPRDGHHWNALYTQRRAVPPPFTAGWPLIIVISCPHSWSGRGSSAGCATIPRMHATFGPIRRSSRCWIPTALS